LALLMSVLFLSACARPTASLQLTSYKDPYFPETYDVKLADCAYYVGPGGDYHIAGRASHTPDDGGGAITQLLHVHMFWKPWPGKTFDNPTTVDATIRYAIVTERGAAVYSGTGFVYPKKRRFSDDVIAKVEVARLSLESESGDPPELLGSARLAGKLMAKDDASLALDIRRQLDLRAGSPE
jgi:hypothetical protein